MSNPDELKSLIKDAALPKTRRAAKAAGLNHYFTGNPCKRGHISIRITTGGCTECQKILAKQTYERNKDAALKRCAARYRKKKKEINENHAAYRKANKEKIAAKDARYRENNKEKIRLKDLRYLSENKDAIYSRAKEYRKRNRDKYLAMFRNINARRRGAHGKHSAEDIQEIKRAQRNMCANCKTTLHKFHVDHIYPIAKGGTNDRMNIQLLCPTCNLRKHAKDPFVFANQEGRLC